MPDLYIGSFAAAPIIVALLQLLKLAGLPSKYAVWINAILSCMAYGLNLLLTAHPEWEPIYVIALNLLVTFLTAAGIYDAVVQPVAKSMAGNRQE